MKKRPPLPSTLDARRRELWPHKTPTLPSTLDTRTRELWPHIAPLPPSKRAVRVSVKILPDNAPLPRSTRAMSRCEMMSNNVPLLRRRRTAMRRETRPHNATAPPPPSNRTATLQTASNVVRLPRTTRTLRDRWCGYERWRSSETRTRRSGRAMSIARVGAGCARTVTPRSSGGTRPRNRGLQWRSFTWAFVTKVGMAICQEWKRSGQRAPQSRGSGRYAGAVSFELLL